MLEELEQASVAINVSPNREERERDQAIYRLIIEGTVSAIGPEFFKALVRNLAQALGTLGAWVTEYLPEQQRLRALAMWMDGRFVEHFEYPIAGTACADVVGSRRLIHIPDRLLYLYAGDPDLKPLNALSYLGAPLLDTDGSVLGHLSVLDNKPMPARPDLIPLFEIFAARAAAEHRRLRIEQDLRLQQEHLNLVLDNALDGIVVLDHEWQVVRANPGAVTLLGSARTPLAGQPWTQFLLPDSAAALAAFARDLSQRPPGHQHLWVPQQFLMQRWDHSVFPAEVTLSRFEARGQVFFTLIFRNADDKLEAERRIRLLSQEADYLRQAVRDIAGHGELLGRCPGMRRVFEAVEQVAPTGASVLIHGETGTGKELVARAIHRASPRSDKPLVTINCAAIPPALIESEFFGHERGAFTGALTRREGRFALAHGGTIFLDEIGELPLEVQGKLLRVLQEGEFEPLGSARTQKVDVRVISASHRDLAKMVAERAFREDLFFRLNVFPIRVPPLRERGPDIAMLAEAFARRLARQMGRAVAPLTAPQRAMLEAYEWPGNVRELQNIIERALILARGPGLELGLAMGNPVGCAPATPVPTPPTACPGAVLTAAEMLDRERANLQRALDQCHGKVAGAGGAAELLGLPPSTLASRLKALGVGKAVASFGRAVGQ